MIMRLFYFILCIIVMVRTFEDTVTEPVVCGFRNIDGIGFKISGDDEQESQYGEFPWIVAIFREEQAGNQTFNIQCEASLVSPEVVLTAAHCVDGRAPKTLRVRAGDWDIQTKAELFSHQERNVGEVIIHPDYSQEGHFNDIAILFLEKPFEIAENVKSICLPPSGMNFDGSRCFVTGWGQAENHYEILKKIELPIVPRDTCKAELRKTRLGKDFELHNSVICAGGEPGKDPCTGAGGSPLICPILGTTDRYYQAGITSLVMCTNDPIPAVYTNVAKLRPWIDEQLAYKKVNSVFYSL